LELWLDDIRKPPDSWQSDHIIVWAKTAAETIALLRTGEVTYASLDHDLGLQEGNSGYAVVCWMEENGIWPKDGVDVHSMNVVGRKRMEAVIERAYGRMGRGHG
jgi:hypothetical protein